MLAALELAVLAVDVGILAAAVVAVPVGRVAAAVDIADFERVNIHGEKNKSRRFFSQQMVL